MFSFFKCEIKKCLKKTSIKIIKIEVLESEFQMAQPSSGHLNFLGVLSHYWRGMNTRTG